MNIYAFILLVAAGLIAYIPAAFLLPRWLFYGVSGFLGGTALYVGVRFVAETYSLLAPHVILQFATMGLILGGWLLYWTGSYKNTAVGNKLIAQGITSLLTVVISGLVFVATVLYMFFTKVPPF